MSLASDLRAVRTVIDTPEKWTKGAFGRTIEGKTGGLSNSVCFCVLGAVRVALPNNGDLRAYCARIALKHSLSGSLPGKFKFSALDDFNDALSTTHADVMALFDVAIKKAEEGENV